MTIDSIAPLVQTHYPHALPVSLFREKITAWLEDELAMERANVLLAKSMCSDEVIFVTDVAGNVESYQTTRRLPGVFEMGGLAGLPFAGMTGMAAFAHHVPDRGAACIFYGPHIGLTAAGELGKVLRPGQHKASTTCGALGAAIRQFQSTPNYEPVLDEDDIQAALLARRLQPHMAQILAAPYPMQAATETVYTITHALIHRYVAAVKEQFGCEQIALIGAVIINTDSGHEDFIDLRHAAVLRMADL